MRGLAWPSLRDWRVPIRRSLAQAVQSGERRGKPEVDLANII